MIKQEIAIISDIHGNSLALKKVLEDINNRGIKTIINLGDSLYGPLDPKGTFELLQKHNVISISGNQDRFIRENLSEKTDFITLEYVKSQIDDKVIEWLNSLPFDTIYDDKIYCCHASPQNDSIYLLESLEKDYVAIKDKNEIDALLTHVKQSIVICGHSHVSKIVETDNKLIVNSGSVGLPAYDDDLPIYHKMENYNPYANYAILNFYDNSIKVDKIAIKYDSESAAKLAELNNRDDWATWIRTGIV
ncbi:metallophosphoesterase family protein [Labilibaculum euxinus]